MLRCKIFNNEAQRFTNSLFQSAAILPKTKAKAVEEMMTGRIRRRSFSSTPSTGSEQLAAAFGAKCTKSPTRDEKLAPAINSKRVKYDAAMSLAVIFSKSSVRPC